MISLPCFYTFHTPPGPSVQLLTSSLPDGAPSHRRPPFSLTLTDRQYVYPKRSLLAAALSQGLQVRRRLDLQRRPTPASRERRRGPQGTAPTSQGKEVFIVSW